MSTSNESENTEVIGEESRSILLGIISQLTKGMDLHRVTLPTFVLEPRSFLERVTDFFTHPDLILKAPLEDDPVERFVRVTRYFLSGWHIQPKGVKKPYNPVIGEFFRCRWEYDDHTRAVFVSEQVSHHPPVSAYYYISPENHLIIRGQIYPKSKFLGNSVASLMQGGTQIEFTNRPGEVYNITMPNVYARGILFGTMVMELGDSAMVRCQKTGLVCDIDFKTKGFFSGSYNALSAKIKREGTGETLYEITGKWTDRLFIKKVGNGSNRDPVVFFDARSANIYPMEVAPIEEQEEFEARRKWAKVTAAMKKRDLDTATAEKTIIEDEQRRSTKERDAQGVEWHPRFFQSHDNDQWECRLSKNQAVDFQAAEHFVFPPKGQYTVESHGRGHGYVTLDNSAEAAPATNSAASSSSSPPPPPPPPNAEPATGNRIN